MDLNNFTPYSATLGGVLIGLAASLLLIFNGKICGVSGITGQLLAPKKQDYLWRVCFFTGLIVGGFTIFYFYSPATKFDLTVSYWLLIPAGILVGYGTRLGNGCTSGHGVCGISRFSMRSIVATCTFMGSGIVTVYVIRHLLGVNG